MELADPVEQLFFIRENGSVPFGAEPADVYEFERAGNRCWIRHKKGEKAYPYGVTRVMEEHPKETLDPCRTVVRMGRQVVRQCGTHSGLRRPCGRPLLEWQL